MRSRACWNCWRWRWRARCRNCKKTACACILLARARTWRPRCAPTWRRPRPRRRPTPAWCSMCASTMAGAGAVPRGRGGGGARGGLVLNVCLNYGGRGDIAQGAAALAARGEPITEASLHGALGLAHVPDPDLLIRTGGEMRISNFLLWQAASSELFFSDRLWPDFDESALDGAIAAFCGRERRFGKTSAQILSAHPDPVPV